MRRIGWELPLAASLGFLTLLGFVLHIEPLAVGGLWAIAVATPIVLLATLGRVLVAGATAAMGWWRRVTRRPGAGAHG